MTAEFSFGPRRFHASLEHRTEFQSGVQGRRQLQGGHEARQRFSRPGHEQIPDPLTAVCHDQVPLVQHAIEPFPMARIGLRDHPVMGLQRIATQKFREPQDTPKVGMAPMSL